MDREAGLKPQVSIGLPVRNGERYLAGALEAIRKQTFSDFDVLISDNASSDRTREIAEAMCNRDSRFRYHRQTSNVGGSANFKYVFHNTGGEYFRWAAHDDLIRPDCLAACVAALEAGPPEAVLAYPRTTIIDEEGREVEQYRAAPRFVGTTPSARLAELLQPAENVKSLLDMCLPMFGVVRRTALKDTSLIANMPRSDTLLLVQLALKGPFIEVDQDLFLRRAHDESSVVTAEKARDGLQRERLIAAWYDPTRGRRFPATVTRLGLGYLHAVGRAPVPLDEKIKALGVVAGWIARNGRIIGGEIKIVIREQFGELA